MRSSGVLTKIKIVNLFSLNQNLHSGNKLERKVPTLSKLYWPTSKWIRAKFDLPRHTGILLLMQITNCTAFHLSEKKINMPWDQESSTEMFSTEYQYIISIYYVLQHACPDLSWAVPFLDASTFQALISAWQAQHFCITSELTEASYSS